MNYKKFFLLYDPYKTHPIRRCFARFMDYYIIVIVFLLCGMLFFSRGKEEFASFILISFFVLFPIINGICVSLFKTTIGKLILGIKVTNLDGSKMSYRKAIGRECMIYFRLLLLSFIPIVGFIISLLFLRNSYYQLINNGYTKWDKATSASVTCLENNSELIFIRAMISIIVFLCITYLVAVIYYKAINLK